MHGSGRWEDSRNRRLGGGAYPLDREGKGDSRNTNSNSKNRDSDLGGAHKNIQGYKLTAIGQTVEKKTKTEEIVQE